MKTFQTLLKDLNACSDAQEWAKDYTIEDVMHNIHRGDWLLWLAKKLDIPLKPLTLAKARCAKTVLHLMKDQRSINAVNMAERFGLTDEVSSKDLRKSAYSAAYATADVDAASSAVYAADAAAFAAASAAATAASGSAAATAFAAASAADAAYAAASASYAASSSSSSAYAAYAASAAATAAASVASVDYAAGAAVAAAHAAAFCAASAAYADNAGDAVAIATASKIENQQQTADICKEILGQLIIDKVNSLLN